MGNGGMRFIPHYRRSGINARGGAMSAETKKTLEESHKKNSTTGDSSLPDGAIQNEEVKQGFGGCLLYPILLLVVQPISFLRMLSMINQNSYAVRYEVIWPYMIYDFLLLAAVILLLVIFFKKMEVLPAMFVFFLVAFSILSSLSANLFWRFPESRVVGSGDPMLSQMVMLFQTLLLVPYFVLDDRVRNTFVNELDDDSVVGIIIKPFVPMAKRLYNWLVGLGKKVYLFAILFVIASFLFGYAVDSIVLHGFIE
jgi:hypothetical protein